ncbi:MAG: hypothetical protein Q7S27_00800 [Nanoarchaeota archaeon]|nr:hypothetical protein [Nanoarchaeota archaeon]
MDKKQPKTTPKNQTTRSFPRKYSREVVDNVLVLIREGKTLGEILNVVQPRKRAILRMARKHSLTITN